MINARILSYEGTRGQKYKKNGKKKEKKKERKKRGKQNETIYFFQRQPRCFYLIERFRISNRTIPSLIDNYIVCYRGIGKLIAISLLRIFDIYAIFNIKRSRE